MESEEKKLIRTKERGETFKHNHFGGTSERFEERAWGEVSGRSQGTWVSVKE